MKKVLVMSILSIFLLSFVFAVNGGAMIKGSDGQAEVQAEIMTNNPENGSLIMDRERVRDFEVNSGLNITPEQIRERVKNGSEFKIKMNNGKNATIKVMPETASETALMRLRLKNCNETNNCTIVLKEVGQGNETRMAYEVQAQKRAKFLGLFGTEMNVTAQVDAETGAIVESKKPWWAFLASEKDE